MRILIRIKQPEKDYYNGAWAADKDFPELSGNIPPVGSMIFPEVIGELEELVGAEVENVNYLLVDKRIEIECRLWNKTDVPAFTEEKGWIISGL